MIGQPEGWIVPAGLRLTLTDLQSSRDKEGSVPMLTEETSLQLGEGRDSFQTCVKLSYNITAGSSSYPAPDPSVPEVPQATFYYSCSDFPDFKKNIVGVGSYLYITCHLLFQM